MYQPKDAVTASIKSTLVTGAAGALISSVQNTLTKQNVTAWGIFTRTGGTIAVFGMHPSALKCRELMLLSSCNGWDLPVYEARFSKS